MLAQSSSFDNNTHNSISEFSIRNIKEGELELVLIFRC